jgi:asparagine synthase (glutamine-hydrolysing)
MCGIAGRFNFVSGAPVSPTLVQQMCDLIAHRGPDGDGTYVKDAVGLGHRRLAIIDLSPAGRQPMRSEDGRLWITFNGEIYNFRELRADLENRGHFFRTRTDTEVLLAAYSEFGVECLSRLKGMFAFAIWDAPGRTLFVARDRLGKKPLHYLVDRDGFAFASEPKAFLADPAFQPAADLEAISHYLSYQYVPSPYSAFRGIRKLPPAHYLLIRDGKLSEHRYWKLSYATKHRISEQEAREEIVSRLRDAVAARLISDVPLGAFLSGGVDSSAVVALMAEFTSRPVKTFSIGFEHDEYNELPYARLVAERYGTEHHEFVVRPDATEIFSKLVWHYNEPYADESAIPTYYLAELTRQHVTVALNGDAGDENFAGYSRYLPNPRFEAYQRLPSPVRATLERLAQSLPSSRRSNAYTARGQRFLHRAGGSPERRYARRVMHFDPDLKSRLCTPQFLQASGYVDSSEILLDAFRESDAEAFLDATLDVDVNHYLPDCLLVKVDIATMAHGLEGRSPLLDHTLMEFAAGLCPSLKLRGDIKKYIFKTAVADLVPSEILERPKMGFGVPLDRWFRNELRPLSHDILLGRRIRERGYFNMRWIEQMVREHETGVAEWHDQLWNLLMLEQWHQMFIDERPAAPPEQRSTVGASA